MAPTESLWLSGTSQPPSPECLWLRLGSSSLVGSEPLSLSARKCPTGIMLLRKGSWVVFALSWHREPNVRCSFLSVINVTKSLVSEHDRASPTPGNRADSHGLHHLQVGYPRESPLRITVLTVRHAEPAK